MNLKLRKDADQIIKCAIDAVLPDAAVKRALKNIDFPGRVLLVAAGKAAWQMAKTASECLMDRLEKGVVITKYDHVKGDIPRCTCVEAGHPVPDENSFRGTEMVLQLVSGLTEKDTVVFLLSGGGSALFEKPLVDGKQLQDITSQLLASGADIVEINTVRKRLSQVKGGKFARLCAPAKVYSIILSDIIGDPLDMIASGPAYPDSSTCDQAIGIIEKYAINLSGEARSLLMNETPKTLDNVTTLVSGSVRELCLAAARACEEIGYTPMILTDCLSCQAKEAGSFLASIAKSHAEKSEKLAFIAGGETVVRLTGKGKGGRNQEIALAAAEGLDGVKNAAVFSVGSDGTDGPTDAAGGYADSNTASLIRSHGLTIHQVLKDNDAYNALKITDGLIITGATGTNVNDVSVVLIG